MAKLSAVAKIQQENVYLDELDLSIERATTLLRSQQNREGYWWYTLEANDSINAEIIFLHQFMKLPLDGDMQKVALQILKNQRGDGSWAIYFDGPGDLSTTVECYFALKLCGYSPEHRSMASARAFILNAGGITQCRVFTRIHLAMFGLVDWSICPAMPSWFIHMPLWTGASIYEFSSWARATIVPLLVIMDQKVISPLDKNYLDELYTESNPRHADWSYKEKHGLLSYERFFIEVDRILRTMDKISIRPFQKSAMGKCELWIREHLQRTEDIYPALAYGALALFVLGYPVDDPTIQKSLKALKQFRMPGSSDLTPLPDSLSHEESDLLYQQCCVSPVWDTPWVANALLDSGCAAEDTQISKTAQWLLTKQITNTYGDWSKKARSGLPGGWSFEFENDYFPDVDDTFEVLILLKKCALSADKVVPAMMKGLQWILSMQGKDGGWGAFDVDNNKSYLNRIPFSDHGACLDPSTADLTGRALEVLSLYSYDLKHPQIQKAIKFVQKLQCENGSWEGRWGVNYLYGTWCVVQGLVAIGFPVDSPEIRKAVEWIKSVQRHDGGFGESCDSYAKKKYVPLKTSVPSQTAWALMTLIAAGEGNSLEAHYAAEYLIKSQTEDGSWTEKHFTGTGFPGHFYIRYHGYRHYFPLMALGKYRNFKN